MMFKGGDICYGQKEENAIKRSVSTKSVHASPF